MQLQRSEMHRFEARGEPFVYLVPSAAVFQLDPISAAVLDGLNGEARDARHIVDELSDRFAADDVTTTLEELVNVRALRHEGSPSNEVPLDLPPEEMPLQNLVLNVTSKCNLSCGYCYEYGEDRVSNQKKPDGTPRLPMMTEETACKSVDFLLESLQPGRDVDARPVGLVEIPVDFALQLCKRRRGGSLEPCVLPGGLDQ